MKRLYGLLCVLLTMTVHVATAQNIDVRGKITDSSGSPISDATINIKGTKLATKAGIDGSFALSAKPGAKLVISAVGYATKEVAASTDMISVSLSQATQGLTEVVVTALGIKREKKSLAYAVQTVGNDQINKSGTGNPLGELDGKVAGLTVINSAGDPGAGTYIRLRGVNSLTGNNQPLMVVDGIPIDNSINNFDPTGGGFQAGGSNGNLTGGAQPTNRGVDINPNDIESVTVLKGPAATALYGIQAASGAIIITTKKGSSGSSKKMTISVSSSATFDQYNKLPDRQNVYAQGSAGTYYGPTSTNSNKRLTWGPAISTLSRDGIANDYDPNGSIVANGSPTAKTPAVAYNPYDFFQTGHAFNNNIALSNGTEKMVSGCHWATCIKQVLSLILNMIKPLLV